MATTTKTDMVVRDKKKSLIANMAAQYGVDPNTFVDTIKSTCMPPNSTKEQFAAFLMVANEYRLNPLVREIYAFPGKGGGIQPIVGVDGWFTLANRHPQFDGIETEDIHDANGNVIAVKAIVHRKDRRVPTTATEYMSECRRNTEPWKTCPNRMLRHKAEIQALRKAFGLRGIMDPDEYERMRENATDATMDVTLEPDAIPEPPNGRHKVKKAGAKVENVQSDWTAEDVIDAEVSTDVPPPDYEPVYDGGSDDLLADA